MQQVAYKPDNDVPREPQEAWTLMVSCWEKVTDTQSQQPSPCTY